MQAQGYIADTYRRFPVTLVRGAGTRVWDDMGREYLDFVAGIAVCSLGHCNPQVIKAAQAQLERLVHVSNLYSSQPQMELAALLCRHSFADRVFFCNSGTEAVESAIKLARRRGHNLHGPDCYEIICLEGSFHGRTLASLSATGQPVYQRGFEPMMPGFKHVPLNNPHALKRGVTCRTCAILLEPIQGEGGVRIATDEFLQTARDLCDEHDLLLMFDEVQVGMGRTGSLFAYEQTPVTPDVMCLAKALGNGLPIGAMLAGETTMSHLTPGSHASTFGGNPVACAAAVEVVKTMLSNGFLQRIREHGDYLQQGLTAIAAQHSDKVKEVRGRGLIQAMEFHNPMPDLALKLLERGILAILSHDTVLRLIPPLVITRDEIDLLLKTLQEIL
ncbi:MAG: aspartate aminotransferase family protein [Deltaproteobacteria bacterium]|jgi:acetylornithine/N-succinyldiaminopimelate aminotransferase|nr:aspartate aminotransferase family protein [Deltaproteobacteria bacterium]